MADSSAQEGKSFEGKVDRFPRSLNGVAGGKR